MDSKKKIAFVTLGCKLNFSETSALAREFERNGYERVGADKVADIYVINTCSVTEHADKKCRNIIRKLHHMNSEAVVAVTGCYAQLKPKEILDIEGVDIVVGVDQKGNLFQIVKDYNTEGGGKLSYSCSINEVQTIFPAFSQGERTRSFLKIQDGCNYCCSYCTIPLARGKSRNLSIAVIVEEAKKIAESGIKEIVLTGVNTGDFGRTTGESFLDLLRELNEIEGIERYRISSIEPNLLSRDIIEWIATGTKFQPHFHIPLQAGSDKILAAMRRRYNTTMFREKIEMIREVMGDVFFGIDVIVGFPGETDEEFEVSYNYLKNVIRPAFIHVFPYSRRANTPAAIMPNQVDERVKHERVERLTELAHSLYDEYAARYKGTTAKVLFESSQKGGMMYGYTENYIKVERKYNKELIGRVSEVCL